MALAIDAIKIARALLNDVTGASWSDAVLMPLLQEAHGELAQELDLNQVGAIKYQTGVIKVPAGQLDLSLNQPINILEPISMFERVPGQDDDSWQDMIKTTFLPKEDQDQDLLYWVWLQERIQFIGATEDREVFLRYRGYLATPQLLTDPLGSVFAEKFIGPRVAALAYDMCGRPSKQLHELADYRRNRIIQRAVLEDQIPVRRRPYRSPKGGMRGPAGTLGSY